MPRIKLKEVIPKLRTKTGSLVAAMVLCAAVLLVSVIYIGRDLRGCLDALTQNYVEHISHQNNAMVQNLLNGELDFLEYEANRMVSVYHGAEDTKQVLREMSVTGEERRFYRLGIINKRDQIWVTDGTAPTWLKDQTWYKRGMNGEESIVLPDQRRFGDPPYLVLAVPVYVDGQVDSVLFGSYKMSTLSDLLAQAIHDTCHHVYVVQPDGNILFSSEGATVLAQNITKLDELAPYAGDDKIIGRIQEDLATGATGMQTLFYDDYLVLYYAPLGINDWYMVTTLSLQYVTQYQNRIMALAGAVVVMIILLFIFFSRLLYNETRRTNKELSDLLNLDKTTGHPSYHKFVEDSRFDKLDQNKTYAYLALDLTHFRLINETCGYALGDEVLKHVADNLSAASGYGEFFARYGGDLFEAVWRWENNAKLEGRLVQFRYALNNHHLNLPDLQLDIVIGIYLFNPKENPYTVRNNAKMAKNSVKKETVRWYAYYTREMRSSFERQMQVTREIALALQDDEFFPFFQPKYDARTQKLAGAEALVRRRGADGKLIPPGTFIPTAEATGQVTLIDRMVFRKVCAQLQQWQREGVPLVPVSVNVSRWLFYEPGFAQEYYSILRDHQLDPQWIQLEITESAAVGDVNVFLPIIEQLQKYGFKLLVDDFGTGYSSLTMLNQLPIDGIKLDKSFVDHAVDREGRETLFAVIDLSRKLGIRLTAEGVETRDQYEMLRDKGCDLIQGYYFGKPMDAGSFREECCKEQ